MREQTPLYAVPPRLRSGYLDRLSSPRREEREIAQRELRLAQGDPVHFLLGELRVLPQIPTWKFSLTRFVQNALHYMGLLILFGLVAVLSGDMNITPVWWGRSESSPPPERPVFSEELRHRRRVGKVIRALAGCYDVRVIGPVCERMHEADEDACWRAQIALKDLLPLLKPSDAALLTPNQRLQLYRLLKTNDEGLLIAVLQAITQIGDSRVLPEVEGLVQSHPNPAVKQAAQIAAHALHLRAEQERLSQTLLRGASAPATSPNTLLRAAQGGAAPVNPNQMLRAAAPEASQNNTQENTHHAQ